MSSILCTSSTNPWLHLQLEIQSHPKFPNPKPKSTPNPATAKQLRRVKSLGLKRPEDSGLLTGVATATSFAVVLLGISISIPPLCLAAPLPPLATQTQPQPHSQYDDEQQVDKEEELAFQAWKSKTFALSVPLTVVALRGSVPPSWVKDFIQSQGKRLRLRIKYLASLENIFTDVSSSFRKPKVSASSTVAADIIGVGDSWLSLAIQKAIIQPITGAERQDWFTRLSHKWKVYLRRNHSSEIDPHGEIWAAPYRWGTMVIAYKKSKFKKHKLAPIQDWADLWRPELAGRISMVDSPREVVGMVLKYMGASYNTTNIELQVAGGRNAVKNNLNLLGKQVRLFDSMHYLKAFGVGDVWVAVGWSSDVLPVAKRMSDVAVIVPKSGASLWADLWVIPAASQLKTNLIGGRVRGPSPLIHQWIEFCLQAARVLPFKQEVIPGTVPSDLESALVEAPRELYKGKPKLETNLVCGVPPSEILSRCEFLEPLPDATLSDYEWLISSMSNPGPGLNNRTQHLFSAIRTFWHRVYSKLT